MLIQVKITESKTLGLISHNEIPLVTLKHVKLAESVSTRN